MGNYAQQYNKQLEKRRRIILRTVLGAVLLVCLVMGALINAKDKPKNVVTPAESEPQVTQSTTAPTHDYEFNDTLPTQQPAENEAIESGSDDYHSVAGAADSDTYMPPSVTLTEDEKKDLPEVLPMLRDVIIDPNYESPYYIVVYVGSQAVVIYSKNEKGQYGVEYKVLTCSTGTTKNPTEPGLYSIYKKERWAMLNGSGEYENYWGQYCSAIGNGYLFHSIPYRAKAVDMMTMDMYNNLGKRASHGCIRLTTRDTKWIYDNCPYGTQVYVTEKEGPTGPTPPQLNATAKYWGYDPTDKWAKDNPYFGGKGNPPKN